MKAVCWSVALGLAALLGPFALSVAAYASSGEATLRSRPIDSVFFVAKSENGNQVHYGVKVDAQCVPVGKHPVYGYWRNFEEGPDNRSELLDIEQRGYGLTPIKSSKRTAHGSSLQVALRALPSRTIAIDVFATPEGCRAIAATRIHGHVAQLDSVFVQVRMLIGVGHLLIRGHRLGDGVTVVEKVRP